jgi:predicted RNA-binding Zn ribbon-like protein
VDSEKDQHLVKSLGFLKYMTEGIKAATKWNLDGGVLCLDFINTIPDRKFGEPHDHLTDFSQVLNWCQSMKLLQDKDYQRLSALSVNDPEKGQAAFRKYIYVRENLWKILSAIANGKDPASKDVDQFNKNLSETLAKLKFEFQNNSYSLVLTKNKDDFHGPLDIILRSAFDLLTKEQKDRIKDCGECGVLYLDVSKNNTRQWCNPNSCGTVIRSRRYQQRKRSKEKAEN